MVVTIAFRLCLLSQLEKDRVCQENMVKSPLPFGPDCFPDEEANDHVWYRGVLSPLPFGSHCFPDRVEGQFNGKPTLSSPLPFGSRCFPDETA